MKIATAATVLLLAAVVPCLAGDDSGMRTWTSAQGQSIQASFVKLEAGTVHLQKADGAVVAIALEKLSAADQTFAANLAEGYGRFTPADRAKFYGYARGSLEETKCWLRKSIRRRVISQEDILGYKTVIDELGPKLNAFIRKTRTFEA